MTAGSVHKRKKPRSPSYPAFDLEVALGKLENQYSLEGIHTIPATVAVDRWGYSPTSGPGQQSIATMALYGLVSVSGRGAEKNIAITDVGRRILQDSRPNSTERTKAIRTAALMPPTHEEVFGKYGPSLPSDDTLRTFLVMERGFTPKAATAAIKIIRTTFAFAHVGAPGAIDDSDDPGEPDSPPVHREAPRPTTLTREQSTPQGHRLTIPLIGGEIAVLHVPIPISRANFEHLMNSLRVLGKGMVAPDDDSNE